MKFRKKPIVIDAVRWTGKEDCIPAIQELGLHEFGFFPPEGSLDIPTLEGTMQALPGDWIIKGVKGEFYPCKPDIFEKTYESI